MLSLFSTLALQILVLPTLRSSVRTRTGELSAKALYGNGRTTLADEVWHSME